MLLTRSVLMQDLSLVITKIDSEGIKQLSTWVKEGKLDFTK
jgi:hypothetical protein